MEQDGPLELLNIDDKKISSILTINDDQISCFAMIPGRPYIMLGTIIDKFRFTKMQFLKIQIVFFVGCSSGILRVCCMADSNQEPISHARPVRNIRLLNYRGNHHRFVKSEFCL